MCRRNVRTPADGPVLLSLEQFAVGSDLELETELGVHEILQFLHDGLQLGPHLGHVALKLGALVLQLTLTFLLLVAQIIQLALKSVVLSTYTQPLPTQLNRGNNRQQTSPRCATNDVHLLIATVEQDLAGNFESMQYSFGTKPEVHNVSQSVGGGPSHGHGEHAQKN